MTKICRVFTPTLVCALATVALLMASVGSATAQQAAETPSPTPEKPNAGAVTFTGALDVPSVYVFRGIVQEADPKLTLWPAGDFGVSLFSGDKGLKSIGLNIGVWNSLQTGSSGSDGPTGRVHYEEDFYTTLAFGLGRGMTVGTTFTAYSSPNSTFNTVKEISFKVSNAHRLAPYGLVAFELTDGAQADGGTKKGTYLELGVAPSWPLGSSKATIAVPVKLGVSLQNYYELAGVDNRFGFLDVGGLVTLPLSRISSRFGSWNVHGGADLLTFGDTTRSFNNGDRTKVVGLFGLGLSY
jgi:hypothetical protein